MNESYCFVCFGCSRRLYFLFVIPFNDWERGFACLVVGFGRYCCSVAKFQSAVLKVVICWCKTVRTKEQLEMTWVYHMQIIWQSVYRECRNNFKNVDCSCWQEIPIYILMQLEATQWYAFYQWLYVHMPEEKKWNVYSETSSNYFCA